MSFPQPAGPAVGGNNPSAPDNIAYTPDPNARLGLNVSAADFVASQAQKKNNQKRVPRKKGDGASGSSSNTAGEREAAQALQQQNVHGGQAAPSAAPPLPPVLPSAQHYGQNGEGPGLPDASSSVSWAQNHAGGFPGVDVACPYPPAQYGAAQQNPLPPLAPAGFQHAATPGPSYQQPLAPTPVPVNDRNNYHGAQAWLQQQQQQQQHEQRQLQASQLMPPPPIPIHNQGNNGGGNRSRQPRSQQQAQSQQQPGTQPAAPQAPQGINNHSTHHNHNGPQSMELARQRFAQHRQQQHQQQQQQQDNGQNIHRPTAQPPAVSHTPYTTAAATTNKKRKASGPQQQLQQGDPTRQKRQNTGQQQQQRRTTGRDDSGMQETPRHDMSREEAEERQAPQQQQQQQPEQQQQAPQQQPVTTSGGHGMMQDPGQHMSSSRQRLPQHNMPQHIPPAPGGLPRLIDPALSPGPYDHIRESLSNDSMEESLRQLRRHMLFPSRSNAAADDLAGNIQEIIKLTRDNMALQGMVEQHLSGMQMLIEAGMASQLFYYQVVEQCRLNRVQIDRYMARIATATRNVERILASIPNSGIHVTGGGGDNTARAQGDQPQMQFNNAYAGGNNGHVGPNNNNNNNQQNDDNNNTQAPSSFLHTNISPPNALGTNVPPMNALNNNDNNNLTGSNTTRAQTTMSQPSQQPNNAYAGGESGGGAGTGLNLGVDVDEMGFQIPMQGPPGGA